MRANGVGVLVLLDDQRLVRKTVGYVFQAGGAVLLPYGITAFDAFEGADAFRVWLDHQAAESVQILLVDYRLGRIHTGVELVEDIRRHPTLHPAVVLIGWSREDAADQFRAAGFAGFIAKARDFDTLMADIAAVCSYRAIGQEWTCLR